MTDATTAFAATITDLVATLPLLRRSHVPGTPEYAFLDRLVERCFGIGVTEDAHVVPGMLELPHVSFGARDSSHLLGIDELILYAFYAANDGGYRTAWDVGANIGAHTVMLAKQGLQVTAFEPDPFHFGILGQVCERNGVSAELRNAAMADEGGSMTFVRVRGNTTSSHLKGLKDPYGELEEFDVETVRFEDAGDPPDLLKVDAEGAEHLILGSIPAAAWERMDALVEFHRPESALATWERLSDLGVAIFAQSLAWERVERVEDMPTSPPEGHVFISSKSRMPWREA